MRKRERSDACHCYPSLDGHAISITRVPTFNVCGRSMRRANNFRGQGISVGMFAAGRRRRDQRVSKIRRGAASCRNTLTWCVFAVVVDGRRRARLTSVLGLEGQCIVRTDEVEVGRRR